MKRKRNLKDDDKTSNNTTTVNVNVKQQTTSASSPRPTSILVTPELKKTVVQSNLLKPTFQSNFINTQKQACESSATQPTTSNTPANKTTFIIQNNSKLVHNSIGSPIVLSAIPTTVILTTKTPEILQSKQYSNDPLIPEWKRTLLEKKKMKKNV